MTAHVQRTVVPLSMLYCPTRRPAIAYPWSSDGNGMANADMPTVAAVKRLRLPTAEIITPIPPRADQPGPTSTSYTVAGPDQSQRRQIESPPGQMTASARTTFAGVARVATGIIYCGSMITSGRRDRRAQQHVPARRKVS